MILGEKIAQLRRKNGWSQEELADKMGVSRQAVSKWESNQTTPDLERILRLSSLFGVTIDYLLKDDAAPEIPRAEAEEETQIRLISLADAADYLTLRERASVQIALGTFLCFLSIIPLLLLGAAAEQFQQSEALAALIGLVSLFLLAAIAVVIFMRCGFHSAPYHFIELGAFRAEGGVNDMVRARKMQFRSAYLRGNLIGVCLCILSPLALFSGILSENDFTQVLLLCVTLLLAGIGVVSFILVGVRGQAWSGFSRKEISQPGHKAAVSATPPGCAESASTSSSATPTGCLPPQSTWPGASLPMTGAEPGSSGRWPVYYSAQFGFSSARLSIKIRQILSHNRLPCPQLQPYFRTK